MPSIVVDDIGDWYYLYFWIIETRGIFCSGIVRANAYTNGVKDDGYEWCRGENGIHGVGIEG